jgi:low temperature requirement protein LtrA
MATRSIISPHDQSVTFVELFFDLVFVFAITQIVGVLHHGLSGANLLGSVLIFWLVWWAWTQFTWALNAANTDHPRVQFFTLMATAVAFFMAVSVPDAFTDGALWFAIPYVLGRSIGLLLYAHVAEDSAHLAAIRSFGLVSVSGLIAVIVGAVLGGEMQYWFWGLAILLDVIAAVFGARAGGWNLHPAHFVERHGLIVIISLGESLIVAASGLTGALGEIEVLVLGALAVIMTCCLWWLYFPIVKPLLEEALESVSGSVQSSMARDVFSLYHFPMLCGIIAFAAAIEEAILHPYAEFSQGWKIMLGAGIGLFAWGSALALWRARRKILWPRVIIILITVILILWAPVIPWISFLIALAGLVAAGLTECWAPVRRAVHEEAE